MIPFSSIFLPTGGVEFHFSKNNSLPILIISKLPENYSVSLSHSEIGKQQKTLFNSYIHLMKEHISDSDSSDISSDDSFDQEKSKISSENVKSFAKTKNLWESKIISIILPNLSIESPLFHHFYPKSPMCISSFDIVSLKKLEKLFIRLGKKNLKETPSTGKQSLSEPKVSYEKKFQWGFGEPITISKSKFFSACCHISTPKDRVDALEELFILFPKYQSATHNIQGWNDSCGIGSEDDGEHKAGRALEFLIEKLNVKNIFVVVTRFYGGTKLGGQRFNIIKNCAKDSIESLLSKKYNL